MASDSKGGELTTADIVAMSVDELCGQLTKDLRDHSGVDSAGKVYEDLNQLWRDALTNPAAHGAGWYAGADAFWDNPTGAADDNWVMGGYAAHHGLEIKGSDDFLTAIMERVPDLQFRRALDCGAGVGRITRDLLTKRFELVDLVEQSSKLVEAGKRQLAEVPNVGQWHVCGLQDFKPEHTYDVIWIQWVMTHLTDPDAVKFLVHCKEHLTPGGVIVVKENIVQEDVYGCVWSDLADCSVTRSSNYLEQLFHYAGLQVIMTQLQPDWPTELYDVNMFCIQPAAGAPGKIVRLLSVDGGDDAAGGGEFVVECSDEEMDDEA